MLMFTPSCACPLSCRSGFRCFSRFLSLPVSQWWSHADASPTLTHDTFHDRLQCFALILLTLTTSTKSTMRMPTLFVNHGGGPMPLLGEPNHAMPCHAMPCHPYKLP
jgi:hypothetical protein